MVVNNNTLLQDEIINQAELFLEFWEDFKELDSIEPLAGIITLNIKTINEYERNKSLLNPDENDQYYSEGHRFLVNDSDSDFSSYLGNG